MKYLRKNDFEPDIFHPYFFIRKYLGKNIKKKSPLLKGKMLDFGCGSKPYRSYFSVNEYVGIDFDNEGHSHDHEDIDVLYDGKTIPFPDNSFDSILSTEVFEHIFNLPELLVELNRVLKRGGCILITCPFVWNEHEVPYDYARYTQFALKDMLSKAGFEAIQIDKSGNFVLVVVQLYILYFFNTFYGKISKFFLARWLYNIFFVFFPNITGVVLNIVLPKNDSLYLNNVVTAYKKA